MNKIELTKNKQKNSTERIPILLLIRYSYLAKNLLCYLYKGFYHLCPPIYYHIYKMTSKLHFGVISNVNPALVSQLQQVHHTIKLEVAKNEQVCGGSSKLIARS